MSTDITVPLTSSAHHISYPSTSHLTSYVRTYLPITVPSNQYLTRFLTDSTVRSRFRLDEDSIRSMLPPDSPDSLIALALQCVSDDVPNRPASGDVVDWLQDLCDSTPEDSLAPPVLTPIEWGHAETSRSFGAGEDTVWTAILSADSSGQSRNAPMSPPLTRTLPHPVVSSRIYNDRSPLIKVTPSKHLDSPLSITVTPTRYPDSPLFHTPSAQLPPLSPSTSPCVLDNLPVRTHVLTLYVSGYSKDVDGILCFSALFLRLI